VSISKKEKKEEAQKREDLKGTPWGKGPFRPIAGVRGNLFRQKEEICKTAPTEDVPVVQGGGQQRNSKSNLDRGKKRANC